MTKKSRYFLIVLGFISFLILAPLIVFFVRGLSFNSKTGRFVQTGLLSYVADPKNSQLFLNGELKKTSSGDINFVPAGEYDVTIKYPGRQDWNKRLSVEAGQVTWANPKDSKVFLFYSKPEIKTLAQNVNDYYSKDDKLVYLQNQSLILTSVNDPQTTENHPLPKPVNNFLAVNDSGSEFILNNTDSNSSALIYFNSGNGQIVDISSLFKKLPDLKFNGDDLFALSNENLYKVDLNQKVLKLFSGNVASFYFQGTDLYLLQQTATGSRLTLSRPPYLVNQTLINTLPDFSSPKIYVSFSKQIFILDDNKLYLASSAMQELAENVMDLNFDEQNPGVPISQAGELDYYDTLGKGLMFITRTSSPILHPVISPTVAHAFYSTLTQIYTTELDGRNDQNSDLLYSGQQIKSFTIDGQGKNMLVLDNGELKSLTVH